MGNIENGASHGDVILVVETRWIIVVRDDDSGLMVFHPLLYLSNQLTAVLEIAIGLPSPKELKTHDRAGLLGFQYAVVGAPRVKPGKPIGYDADQDAVALRAQKAERTEAGEFGVVGVREDRQSGFQIGSPR
jgi:hypothetical protein